MKAKRTFRREIFSETKQLAFMFSAKNKGGQLCEICKEKSVMIAPETVAGFLSIGTRKIYRLIETGRIHFFETDQQQVLVCVKSLTQTTGKENPKIEE